MRSRFQNFPCAKHHSYLIAPQEIITSFSVFSQELLNFSPPPFAKISPYLTTTNSYLFFFFRLMNIIKLRPIFTSYLKCFVFVSVFLPKNVCAKNACLFFSICINCSKKIHFSVQTMIATCSLLMERFSLILVKMFFALM